MVMFLGSLIHDSHFINKKCQQEVVKNTKKSKSLNQPLMLC